MAEAGAGADQPPPAAGEAGPLVPGDPAWRDWAGGLPEHVLVKVAGKHIAQTEAGWAAQLKVWGYSEAWIQGEMARRKQDGNCPLFVFARVCKPWRKAQLKVGGPLRTRVYSDVILPGRVALAKWALAEGCPWKDEDSWTMGEAAAWHGHEELVGWLIQEQSLVPGDPDWRDWAGLPEHLLVKVAGTLVAQTEAGEAAQLKEWSWSEEGIQDRMAERKRDGNCLFVFARVCKEWRKAQLKVGGPLRTRVHSDVLLPGSVALVKWALAEGCPREHENGFGTMAHYAAEYGHTELVKYLCGEGGFAMDERVMLRAASSGNLQLVQWLRGEGCDWSAWVCRSAAAAGRLGVLQWLRANGCPWDAETCKEAAKHGHLATLRWARENGCDWSAQTCISAAYGGHLDILKWLRAEGCPWDGLLTCHEAVEQGHVEVLRWARENGASWHVETRDIAAAALGYTDDLGNTIDMHGEFIDDESSDDEYSDDE